MDEQLSKITKEVLNKKKQSLRMKNNRSAAKHHSAYADEDADDLEFIDAKQEEDRDMNDIAYAMSKLGVSKVYQ